MKIVAATLCIWLFIGSPAVAQEQGDTVLLTNIGVWDGSSREVRNDQHILIVFCEIVVVGPQQPTAPAGATILDGSGHVALGTIAPGLIANFVVLDANPQEDILVLARADQHTQLVVKDGKIIENHYHVMTPPEPEAEDPDHMPHRMIGVNYG